MTHCGPQHVRAFSYVGLCEFKPFRCVTMGLHKTASPSEPLLFFELHRGLLAELDPTGGFKAQPGRVFQIQLLSNASFVRIDCCDA